MNEQIENLNKSIERLKSKEFGFYFFTLDTKGNPVASVANIYEHVKTLNGLGYKAHILHEKDDYKLYEDENGMGLANWLGEEYANLPHVSIESKQLQIGPSDFVIIPEVFAGVMKQTASFPCKRIVFLQSYEYVFELLELGENWGQLGINQVITTNERQREYIEQVFRGIQTEVIPVGISEVFKPNVKPKKPIVSVSVRDKREMLKLIKVFYQKYPHYKFVTFRDMSGMSKEDFAAELSESFLSVWIDEMSGFGTFPLESMICDTPVIGKIPRMVPEWMGEMDPNGNLNLKTNGIWTANLNAMPDIVATLVGLFLEDSIPENIVEGMGETKEAYSMEKMRTSVEEVYGRIVGQRVIELESIKTNEEEKLAQKEQQEVTTENPE